MLIPLGILNAQGAAAGGAAYDLLETQVLSSSAASVTFTGLGSYSGYKHLQIRAVVQQDFVSTNAFNTTLRFNGDTGSNYYRHILSGNGTAVSSAAPASAGSSILLVDSASGKSNTSIFGSIVIDILDFANTNKNKTIRALTGTVDGEKIISFASGAWFSTSAITSFQLGSNWTAGCRFSLYGIK